MGGFSVTTERHYPAFKDLLELIRENCAAAVAARIRQSPILYRVSPPLPYVRFASNFY
jgi:hypothetical protein